MSRCRYAWYPLVQRIVYYVLDDRTGNCTPMEQIYESAVYSAMRQFSIGKDRQSKLALIDMVFRKKSHTVCGAALKLYISERTAQRWMNEFIYIVAEKLTLYTPKKGK